MPGEEGGTDRAIHVRSAEGRRPRVAVGKRPRQVDAAELAPVGDEERAPAVVGKAARVADIVGEKELADRLTAFHVDGEHYRTSPGPRVRVVHGRFGMYPCAGKGRTCGRGCDEVQDRILRCLRV